MGGCQSHWLTALEIASPFLGGPIAGAITGKPEIDSVNNLLTGGTKGCNKDKDAIVQATNEITALAIVLSVNSCQDLAQVSQEITITCNPTVEAGHVYEENASCAQCYTSVFNGMKAQHALERKVWADGGEVKVRTPINDEYALLISRVANCGINTCKACTLSNVTQANVIRENTGCQNIMRDQTQFKSNLSSLIQEQLLNNQDVLSGLAQALGAQGVNQITEKVVNQISSKVTQTFLDNTVDKMQQSQVITIDTGTKTLFNNVSQFSSFNIALDEVTSENIVLNSINIEVFDTIAQVANEQNTLNDIGEVVFQSTVDFEKAIDNVVGQVMIAVLVGLGVVVAFIIGYALYRFFKKTAIETEHLNKQIELQKTNWAAFQQF